MSDISPAANEAEIKEGLKKANALYAEKKYTEALPIYERLSQHCGASELWNIGWIYSENRQGIAQDLVKSHSYHLRAADKGQAFGKVRVALNIVQGLGVEKDVQKGLDMLIKAVTETNLPWGQLQLGRLYYNGSDSIKRDFSESLRWYQLAAQKNNTAALYNLGWQHEHGEGVEKNIHTAYEYYSRALRYGVERDQPLVDNTKRKLDQVERALWPPFTFDLVNCDKDLRALTDKIAAARTLKVSMLISGPRGSGKKAYVDHLAGKLGLQTTIKGVLDVTGPLNDVISNIRKAFSDAIRERRILAFEKIDHLLSEKRGVERDNRVIIAELISCMKGFPFPFIYLLADEAAEISPDLRDEFMIGVQFNFLNRKQNREAFQLFFLHDPPAELSSIGALTSQDYRHAKQSLFAIGDESNDAAIIDHLRAISQKKTSSLIQIEGNRQFDPDLVNCDANIVALTEKLKHQDGNSQFSMLLYGPPGTGKSEYLRYLAEQLGMEIIVKRASDILSKWIGEAPKAIAQTFREAALRKSFLVFDEADSLLAQRDGETSPWHRQQVNEMLTWMETHRYPFACTTNLVDNIDRAALRRFVFKMQFDYLSKEQARKAFTLFFGDEAPEELGVVGGLTPGDFSVARKKAKIFGELSDKKRLVELLAEEAKKKSRSAISYIKKDSVSFNPKLVNPDPDLAAIESRLVLPDARKNFSFLLYGPPGTGKSNYLRHLAGKMDIEFIEKRASDILGRWLGESEKAIAAAFTEAEDRKAFLVFDEADSLLASRRYAQQSWQISQVNEMLSWMERHPYPFACTTNLADRMDEAAMRRFTFKVKLDFLKQEQIAEAFREFFNMDVPDDVRDVKMLTPAIFASVKKKTEIFGTTGDKDKIAKLMKDEIKIFGYREPEKIADTVLEIPALGLSTRPLSEGTSALQAAVVTIKSNSGHGSGYFVASDGYLLTNQHVVKDNKFVTVKLTTGRHLPGEVLRSNAERDIALVKVNEANMTALPLLLSSAEIGSEVYAVGTPIEERYSTTITKGIISAYRTENGLTFIQSDVSVQPGNSGGPIVDRFGNVVATCVQARLDTSSGQRIGGVNYFIPIADALKFLAIELIEKNLPHS